MFASGILGMHFFVLFLTNNCYCYPRAPATQPAVHITGYVYFPTSISLHEDEQLLATGCKGFEGVGMCMHHYRIY